MPLPLDFLQSITNVHWGGGPIIQLSMSFPDDYMNGEIIPGTDEGLQGLGDPPYSVKDFTFEDEDHVVTKYWLNLVSFGGSGEIKPVGDFDYDPVRGIHYQEYLVYFTYHPREGLIPPPHAEVQMTSISERDDGHGPGSAHLRIYPHGTIWRVIPGEPARLVANQSPSYDESMTTASTISATWPFGENGWL